MEDLDERLRSRLSDPELSRVFVLEEAKPPLLGQLGSLGLELLSHMTFEKFDARGLGLSPEQRHSLQEAHRNAREFAAAPDGLAGAVGPQWLWQDTPGSGHSQPAPGSRSACLLCGGA